MIFSDARRLLGLKAYPSHISLQFLLVEPYICEMTDNSMYINEIAGRYAYFSSYAPLPQSVSTQMQKLSIPCWYSRLAWVCLE